MNVFICDDEPQILKNLSERVKIILPDCTVTEFADSEKLSEALRTPNDGTLCEPLMESKCEILLLDIDMPNLGGMDIAGQLNLLPKRPLLVFVTSHDELVYDSLMFHPFGFIRKSCLADELEKVLLDCRRELSKRENYFTFKSGSENIRLKVSEILYLESEGNYLKLYAKGQIYRIRNTIAAMEEALSEKGFIRFHRGFLVNQQAVKRLGADEAELVTGMKIPIGRNYGEKAKVQLMRYMLK